jgi:hypothetical protein
MVRRPNAFVARRLHSATPTEWLGTAYEPTVRARGRRVREREQTERARERSGRSRLLFETVDDRAARWPVRVGLLRRRNVRGVEGMGRSPVGADRSGEGMGPPPRRGVRSAKEKAPLSRRAVHSAEGMGCFPPCTVRRCDGNVGTRDLAVTALHRPEYGSVRTFSTLRGVVRRTRGTDQRFRWTVPLRCRAAPAFRRRVRSALRRAASVIGRTSTHAARYFIEGDGSSASMDGNGIRRGRPTTIERRRRVRSQRSSRAPDRTPARERRCMRSRQREQPLRRGRSMLRGGPAARSLRPAA